MDGGGSMQSNEEKGAEKLMDDYLKSIGLHRKKIAKDGSCLFRAVAEQVLHCQSLHTEVRAECVEFLKRNRGLYEAFVEGDFEDYLSKLQDPQHWVGEVEINALAVMYKRDFLIFQEPGKRAVSITDNNFKDKVQLCFLNGNHYDSVYPISHMKNAALCQSILYEVLYDDVFKVDRGFLGMCQRVGRPSDLLSDDSMAVCGSSDESDPDAGEPLWVESETTKPTRHSRGRGRGRHLSERVRRSLNPTLFRNIEYDVWHKTKRAQQKMDYYIAAGMQFTVGDRCQVRLEGGGRSYVATIKEVPPNNGPVTVYIEELGRKQVPLWCLRPANDEGRWSTVVSREKRLSNGHGEWEDRGKGRGRGKHTTASSPSSSSSAVSQATAPGSSGRVQKQHSWPPQATVEEQGGVKASRKSMSTVESGFGLTEEQRLAKEEEERNVALVELQLRDEHSFPALGAQSGVQGDGGRKKGGEKKKLQRNKTKSPVQDVTALSPSAGEGPKSSSPTLASAATTAPTTNTTTTTTPPTPTLPGPKPAAAPSTDSDSSPAGLRSAAAAVASSPPLTTAAPAAKTNAPSAGAPPSSPPPAAAPSTKPSGAVPSSATLFSLLTPVLPAASSPPTTNAPSTSSPPASSKKLLASSSSSLLPKSSASPPPSSSLPPPTFIAPIAPCPAAAQGFLPPTSLTRSPVLRSPSPPSFSSSSVIHHAARVHEAPPVSAQTPNSSTDSGGALTKTQDSLSQTHPQVSQTQTQASLTQTESHAQPPQMPTETRSSLPPPCSPHLQHQPQPHTDVASLPQAQTAVLQPSVPQTQVSVSHLQPQSEVVLVQSSHPAPDASHPHTTQASVPVSAFVQPQSSVTPPHLHVQPAQPPHPSQVPHPSLSLSASQTPNTQNQTEALLPPTQPQPDSAAHSPSQQPHPPPPSHLAHPPPPPPHPQSILGAVPLQQLSQLYQDPLYPGFPLGEKGDMAQTPSFSSNKSGDDLPEDVNILRFFFNLGVKAYSMPMFAPYMYLLPLQQAHTMHPKLPSRSPSPQYPPSNPPTRHQETYPHLQYPPTSAAVPPQYEHQAPLAEPPHPSDPFNQAGYPMAEPHRMPCPSSWQQHQMPPPRNPTFPVGYPTPSPPYPVAQTLSQSYHPGQGQGPPLFPLSLPPYPPSSLGYQSSPAHEEPQMSQAVMEQHQPANGDTMSAQGLVRVPGPAAANSSRSVVVSGFAGKKEQGESLPRTVLLVDPPLNPNNPILVENLGVKDVPVAMTTMKTSSTPGSPLSYNFISRTIVPGDNSSSRGYRGNHKLLNPTGAYVSPGPLEPSQVGYHGPTMAEHPSIGCNTEDDWEEQTGFKPTSLNHRGPRRSHRGGRGRGGHDPGRGTQRRRYGGEAGVGFSYSQFNPSYRGRGRERGY
uniref:OTU domain-containing protein 4 n=1 Tax=Scatophagus argus TaxID=75038 RepID=UPI001ED80F9A|nr:OTU domain-containing protein 4 [Scatophagus argus]XP_046236949.1 OTU domain-containing protein 4 [Scatophagus argus]